MSLLPRCPRRASARPRHACVRRGRAVALVALASFGLSACASAKAQTAAPGSQDSAVGAASTEVFGPGKGPVAPRVTGKTLGGATLSLSRFRGHVLVLNFWGSWCAPCRQEAHTLGLLSRQYSSAGVRFLGVDVRDSPASAEAYMRDFGVGYPSLNDPGGQVALAFRTTVPPAAIPTTLVLSPGGRVSARVIGPVTYQGLRNLIQKTMAQDS